MRIKTSKNLNPIIPIITLLILLQPLLTTTASVDMPPPPSQHFVLVHGGGHGAWCWYKLIPLLKSSGHKVTAVDLAASGTNLRTARSLRSISEYFEPLMDFMGSLGEHERVILVGHSRGGLALSAAMERFPSKVSSAVFVTAYMPGPTLNVSTLWPEQTRSVGSLVDSHYTYDDGPNNPPTTVVFGPKFISDHFYPHSPIQDKELAKMMVRPLRLFSVEEMSKVLVLTKENYGSVKRVFVLAEEDRVLKEDFQRWMIERNPPDQTVQIKGSDHLVMISKPRDLWAYLVRIASMWGC